MRRREFITILGGAASWPLSARAQQPVRVRRIGVLIGGGSESDPEFVSRVAAFRDGLQRLGWADGRNVSIDYRWAAGDPNRLRANAAELVGMAPDAIFSGGTAALAALHQATRTVPIVFAQVADPVAQGFVTSLARPVGNITGFALYENGVAAKHLELLKQIAPLVARAVFMYDPVNPAWPGYLREIEAAAPSLGVRVSGAAVHNAADIEQTFDALAHGPNGGLIALTSPIVQSHRELIIALAARHRLPAVYGYRFFVADGGLASYGVDNIELYGRAAAYVDRILKGEKPGDLPVQFSTKFELVINLKTAKALGLDIAATFLLRADELIE
jgi:putative tryptophan/tyrosine transport system substrate-binding protein